MLTSFLGNVREHGQLVLVSHKKKVVALGLLAGFALAGSLWSLYRRRRRSPVVTGSSRLHTPSQRPRHYISSSSTNASTVVGVSGDASLSHGQDTLICAGIESLNEAVKNWEQAIHISVLKHESTSNQLIDQLETLLDKAQTLRDDFARFISCYNCSVPSTTLFRAPTAGEVRFASTLPESASMVSIRKTMSILSDDSFLSALDDFPIPSFPEVDVLNRPPLKLEPSSLVAYSCGLKEVRAGNVVCRISRAETLRCTSDDDYLAKLYCVRKAFFIIFQDDSSRDWLSFQGRELLSNILRYSNKDTSGFGQAYDSLLQYASCPENWSSIEAELQTRHVPQLSFYDVLLDFILLDAFEDLSRPPASVLAVAQNRFLSASFKESTLQTVVWSVLKAKRTRLKVADGFISHFYDVSEQVSPTLAWGFLGTDDTLRELCYFFKDQIYCFLTDIFSTERVDYSDFEALADDVWRICKGRVLLTSERLTAAI